MMRGLVGARTVGKGVVVWTASRMAIAARRNDEVVACAWNMTPVASRWSAFRLPLLRGLTAFLDSSIRTATVERWLSGSPASTGAVRWAAARRILGGLVALTVLPDLAAWLAYAQLPESVGGVASVLLSFGLRILVFGVLLVRALGEDQAKLAGAEHMVAHAWDARGRLSADQLRRWSRFHPHHWWGWMTWATLLTSVVAASTWGVVALAETHGEFALAAGPLVAVVAVAVAYEILRFVERNEDSPFGHFLVQPSFAVQRWTTRTPTDDDLELALESLALATGAGHEFPRGSAAAK